MNGNFIVSLSNAFTPSRKSGRFCEHADFKILLKAYFKEGCNLMVASMCAMHWGYMPKRMVTTDILYPINTS